MVLMFLLVVRFNLVPSITQPIHKTIETTLDSETLDNLRKLLPKLNETNWNMPDVAGFSDFLQNVTMPTNPFATPSDKHTESRGTIICVLSTHTARLLWSVNVFCVCFGLIQIDWFVGNQSR